MKKQKLLAQKADNLVICNVKKRVDHCNIMCLHGIPHEKETERGACHNKTEICTIHKGIVKVKCRFLTIKEKQKWIKDNYGNC